MRRDHRLCGETGQSVATGPRVRTIWEPTLFAPAIERAIRAIPWGTLSVIPAVAYRRIGHGTVNHLKPAK